MRNAKSCSMQVNYNLHSQFPRKESDTQLYNITHILHIYISSILASSVGIIF